MSLISCILEWFLLCVCYISSICLHGYIFKYLNNWCFGCIYNIHDFCAFVWVQFVTSVHYCCWSYPDALPPVCFHCCYSLTLVISALIICLRQILYLVLHLDTFYIGYYLFLYMSMHKPLYSYFILYMYCVLAHFH